jgi:hypothetical protein
MNAIRRYAPGQHVEYNSLSAGRWIEAVVDYVHSDGTVDLDVRDRADARYIRELSPRVQRAQRAQRPVAQTSYFRIGERVEYHSQKNQCWVYATVRRINRDGTIDIDRDDGVYHAADPKFVRSAANFRPARVVHVVQARPAPRARVVRQVQVVQRVRFADR